MFKSERRREMTRRQWGQGLFKMLVAAVFALLMTGLCAYRYYTTDLPRLEQYESAVQQARNGASSTQAGECSYVPMHVTDIAAVDVLSEAFFNNLALQQPVTAEIYQGSITRLMAQGQETDTRHSPRHRVKKGHDALVAFPLMCLFCLTFSLYLFVHWRSAPL